MTGWDQEYDVAKFNGAPLPRSTRLIDWLRRIWRHHSRHE